VELLSLLGREDRLDILLRLLMDRFDLRLLFCSQVKAAQRVAPAASARTTPASWTAWTAHAGRTLAALPAAAHAALLGTLIIHAARRAWAALGTTTELRTAAALLACSPRVLRALCL
jgi:hypothetical protein